MGAGGRGDGVFKEVPESSPGGSGENGRWEGKEKTKG